MVRVTLIKDIFSNTKETFDIDSGITVNNIIEDNFTSKSCDQIEVYNQQTGETRFVEESENDFEYDVIVNDKKVTDFNIPLNDGDNVVILTVPKSGGNPVEWIQDTIEDITDNFWSGMNNGWDAFGWGAIGGALGFGLFGLTGLGIGILAGITISGYQENKNEKEVSTSTSTSKSGKDITDIPDASGSRNSSILDKKYPLLLGKHLITPYVCGSPYNETNGTKGKNTYTHLMLCAGYSPLKLTDFKLGDLYLAHNKSNTVSGHLNERETVMHGKLTGYVDNNYDSGDILRRWKLNDVSIEIMQKGGDSSDNSDAYPSVYPQAVIQSSPDATVLFVCDGTIGDVATYKGCSFDSGYRTNSVRFSDSCPSAMEVEISAPNGLYKSRTHTTKDGKNSTTVYEYSKLPIYLAIQWRYYKDSNASSSGDNGSGWTSFSSLNGVSPVTLTRDMIASSTSAHTGNSFPDNYHDYTDNWIGCQVFNLEDFSGEESDGSLSQMRFVARYDFSSAECLKISGLYSVGSTLNADLNSVEVRVIRVDSSYLDETTTIRDSDSGDNYGAYSFNDVTKWSYLRTFKYDEDAFKKAVVYDSSGNITSYPSSMDSYKLRPYNLEDSKKFCFIALKIKADLTGEVNGQLDKINCIAESFAPTYNSATGSWSIPSVVSEYKYYDSSLNEITQEQYEAGIESGEDVTKKKTGNDYNSQLRALLWNSSCYSTANSRYFLPSSYDSLYISNNIASVYLAAMIGTHLGREAKPYSEINMQSVAEAYSFYEDVTDGSTYSERDSEYVVGGTNIRHMRWTFNGYITEATKLETLVQNILNTGRACQTIDDKCRYQIIIDKKRNYPVMLINQQNCISFSNMRSFEDNISGYKVTFQNEDDGYDSSTLYAMMDGEDYKNPTNDVTATSFKYVTNPVQVWSLARYNLARLLVEKEYLERTVGLAGISLQLGDMVNVQDDTILVGTGTGARVQQLIADDAYIYGFVTDELYDYTGEVNTSGKCKLGVKILQPSKWNASRIVTLRMAATSGVTMADGTLLAPVVGKTNNVIFERPIIKSSQKLVDSDDADVCLYLPEVDNIVAFGEVENIISQYIVAKITPQEGFKYKLLLYPYDDSIYSYGSSMPTIQANMTKPNRTGDDNIALSTGVTQEQLNNQITSSISVATTSPSIELLSDNQVIIASQNGDLTPSSAFTVTAKINNTTIAAWTFAVDGGDFSSAVPTGVSLDTANNIVTITPNRILFTTLSIKATDGTVYDVYTVSKVTDGSNGYTVILSNESHNFQGGVSAAEAAEVTTTVSIYAGSTLLVPTSVTVDTTKLPSGMTSSVGTLSTATDVTFAVADGMASSNGVIPITIVADGVTFTKEFSYTVSYYGSEAVYIYAESVGCSIPVDDNGYATAGTYTTKVHAIYNGNELPFEFGTFGTYKGITITTNGHIITFTIAANTFISTQLIYIPIVYKPIKNFFLIGSPDQDRVLGFSDGDIDYELGYWSTMESSVNYTLSYLAIATNSSGYLGIIESNESTILDAGYQPNLADYFLYENATGLTRTYNGTSVTFSMGQVYKWNGSYWEVYTGVNASFSIEADTSKFSRVRAGTVTPNSITVSSKITLKGTSSAYKGYMLYTDSFGDTQESSLTSATFTIANNTESFSVALYTSSANTGTAVSILYFTVPFDSSVAPTYLGAVTAMPTSNIIKGDTVLWNGDSTYTSGMVYQYNGSSWSSLSYTDSVNSSYYMAALKDILANNATSTGYFDAVFCSAFFASSASIGSLQTKTIELQSGGNIQSSVYSEGSRGFLLDGDSGNIKSYGSATFGGDMSIGGTTSINGNVSLGGNETVTGYITSSNFEGNASRAINGYRLYSDGGITAAFLRVRELSIYKDYLTSFYTTAMIRPITENYLGKQSVFLYNNDEFSLYSDHVVEVYFSSSSIGMRMGDTYLYSENKNAILITSNAQFFKYGGEDRIELYMYFRTTRNRPDTINIYYAGSGNTETFTY